jgi:hypothetical protein
MVHNPTSCTYLLVAKFHQEPELRVSTHTCVLTHAEQPSGTQSRAKEGGPDLWKSKWKITSIQGEPFSLVNFSSELLDSKTTWKCKKEGWGDRQRRKRRRRGKISVLEIINPTDSRAVNMNSIWFCHVQKPAF